jgi:membrane protease YdiL (CAAX protease family)
MDAGTAQEQPQTSASRPSRAISLLEFLVAAAIIIGHNVFHVVPNEVPILFVLGMVSFRLREGSWSAIGFAQPASWKRTILLAAAIAAIRLLGGALIESVTAHFWPPVIAPSGANEIAGHPLVALQWLALVWTFAAFGEEASYRGYLLTRAADVGGRTQTSLWIAAVLSGVLFGFGHYYKGPAGVVDSVFAGLLLGAAYVLTRRNLWVCILAHGFIDTVGILAVFFGLDT